jgi:hypothetical protein
LNPAGLDTRGSQKLSIRSIESVDMAANFQAFEPPAHQCDLRCAYLRARLQVKRKTQDADFDEHSPCEHTGTNTIAQI